MFNLSFTRRNVVTGLEGCGKSSRVFEYLWREASPKYPILFGMKNYALMEEQRLNWITKLDLPEDYFAICGLSKENENALAVYTNKEHPQIIPENARFVFTSQANLQRNNFHAFAGKSFKRFSHVVIDEFDFTTGIIPTLDYELQNMREGEIKEATEKEKKKWVVNNYTFEDYSRINNAQVLNIKGFTVAYWLDDLKEKNIPVTFLTSELLAKQILKAIGFEETYIESPSFKDCTINTWSSPLVGRTFFNKMNQDMAWDKLSYDLIISDYVNSYMNAVESSLDVTVLTHTGIRGSNQHINKKILTILSHIPNRVIKEIQDALNYFNVEISYSETESLFYRDRLCQSIGRVLGNRGGKETDLIVHQTILDKISSLDDLPYTLNTNWEFKFEGAEPLLDKVTKAEQGRKVKYKERKKQIRKAVSFTFLEDYFELDASSILTCKEVKQYCKDNNIKSVTGQGFLSATKIARYFVDAQVKPLRKGTTVQSSLVGLRFKKKV